MTYVKTVLAAIVCVLSLSIASCGKLPTKHNDTVLTIATQASHPPFAYLNKDKKMVGFNITLINDLCAFMLIECRVVHDTWGELLPSLQHGKYDAVIAAMSVNSENQKQVDFTDSYYEDPFALIVNKTADIDTQTMNDATIAVLHASEAQAHAERQYPKAHVTGFKTQSSAFLALLQGSKEAVYSDEAAAKDWIEKNNDDDRFTIITEGQAIKKHMIAVQKGSDLREQLNQALEDYKQSGEYQKLYEQYFVETEWQTGLPIIAAAP